MKVVDSGMPDEKLWKKFFKPEAILRKMGLSENVNDVADFGSGYGTFTMPAARIVSGTVYAIDLEKELVRDLEDKAKKAGLNNVRGLRRDIIVEGTGLEDCSIDYVMLFNILHGKTPPKILAEAYRILKPKGTAAVIHWNYDPTTPRGPPMRIRLRPEQIIQTGERIGLKLEKSINLKPYHYGLIFSK